MLSVSETHRWTTPEIQPEKMDSEPVFIEAADLLEFFRPRHQTTLFFQFSHGSFLWALTLLDHPSGKIPQERLLRSAP
jgi:hypothetical protein